jgi:glycosyltransferase involved in cell wall biosynthesis
MRIVISTGIYPPDIGGPAQYAKGVKESLERSGHAAPLAVFGFLKRLPTGIRHILYAVKLFYTAWGADAIFAFDTYSVGVPAAFVGMLLRVPVVIRVGGDFVWESYVERTEALIPLPHFYQRMPSLGIKERIAYFFVRWMLRHAHLAFNTQWLLDIWQPVYGFSRERAEVIGNVIGERIPSDTSDRTMLLYGRSLVLKNAPAFRRAYARARKRGLDITLEERTVPYEQFIERIRSSHAVVLPSVSEVAPNTVIDALRCGKPFLLTKYSGYAEEFKDYGVIVDPLDEEDMARGMEALADEKGYKALCAHIATFDTIRTYDDVAADLLRILTAI